MTSICYPIEPIYRETGHMYAVRTVDCRIPTLARNRRGARRCEDRQSGLEAVRDSASGRSIVAPNEQNRKGVKVKKGLGSASLSSSSA